VGLERLEVIDINGCREGGAVVRNRRSPVEEGERNEELVGLQPKLALAPP